MWKPFLETLLRVELCCGGESSSAKGAWVMRRVENLAIVDLQSNERELQYLLAIARETMLACPTWATGVRFRTETQSVRFRCEGRRLVLAGKARNRSCTQGQSKVSQRSQRRRATTN